MTTGGSPMDPNPTDVHATHTGSYERPGPAERSGARRPATSRGKAWRAVRLTGAIMVGLVVMVGSTPPAGAQDDDTDNSDPLGVEATVNGRAVEGAGSNDPVELRPLEVTDAELTVTNTTGEDLSVRRARLFGKAFGFTFVAYDAMVDVPVPAGSSAIIEIPIEFVDLERQATGLLPGGFALYDRDREVLGQQDFVIDVRGSATSALGLFGLFITGATIIGLVGIYLGVKRRTLEPKRWRRALRFAFVGLGMGLTAVVALAVFRVVAPTPIVWIPLTVLPALGLGLIGFTSPGPLRIDEDEEDIEDLEELEYLDELARIEAAGAAAGVPADDTGPLAAATTPGAVGTEIDLTDTTTGASQQAAAPQASGTDVTANPDDSGAVRGHFHR